MDQFNLEENSSSSQIVLQLPCAFCLKPASILSEKLDSRFLTCWSQFLGKRSTVKCKQDKCNFYCCSECNVLVNLFCEQYFQWQCLKLSAHWTVERLVNIVKLASKVPSRNLETNRMLHAFKTLSQSVESNTTSRGCKSNNTLVEPLKDFRKDFVKKCTQKRAKCFPRVCLSDINARTINKSVLKMSVKQECDDFLSSPGLAYFFGWMFTNSVVILLATDFAGLQRHSTNRYNKKQFEISKMHEFNFVDEENEKAEDSANVDLTSLGSFPLSPKFQTITNDEQNQPVHCEDANIAVYSNDEHGSTECITLSQGMCSLSSSDTQSNELNIYKPKKQVDVKPEIKPAKAVFAFSCQHCSKTFKRKSALNCHCRRVHPTLPTRPYKCKTCNKSFWCYEYLRHHNLYSNVHKIAKSLLKTKTSRKSDKSPSEQISKLLNSPEKQSKVGEEKIKNKFDVSGSKSPTLFPEQQSTTNTKAKHSYGLRANRKRSYKKFANSDCESDGEYKLEHKSSSSSESEISSYDDEQNVPVSPRTEPRLVVCRRDGCELQFPEGKGLRYKEHQKLHEPGNYKCKFCAKVESNIARLSQHELLKHSRTKLKHGNKIWIKFCPRCKFETAKLNIFRKHFAEIHIGGFNSKKGQKSFVECNICKLSIFNHKNSIDNHFKSYHDKTNLPPENIINCDFETCKAYFLKASQKETHKKIVHNLMTNSEVADQFENELDDKISENFAVMTNNGKMEFECKHCQKRHYSLRNLKEHLEVYHSKLALGTIKPIKTVFGNFLCPTSDCSRKFRNEVKLDEHKKLHGSFKCNFCNVVKEYAPDLALHELEHPRSSLLKSGRTPKNPIISKWKCFRCFQKCLTKQRYIRHFVSAHLDLKFDRSKTCPVCHTLLTNNYKQHHKSHHEKMDGDLSDFYTCHLCPAYFVTGYQLSQHLCKFHWKSKCPECAEDFSQREVPTYKLIAHLEQFHSNHLPYIKFACEYSGCCRRFFTQAELESHNGLHQKATNNYTKVKCSQCTKEFKTNFDLHKHNSIVHVPRSFVCDECGKAFKTKLALNTHTEFHKDPKDWQWQCSECGRKCVTKQKLDQHKRTHTKEKPFVCQYCGDKYAHQHNWRNHVKTKHSDIEGVTNSEQIVKGKYMSRKGSKKGECIMAGTSQK